MARFDVYANPYAPERGHTPYVLDVQSDHLGPLATRVVIPLRAPEGYGTPAQSLNPVLQLDGKSVVLDTASLAPVPSALLKKAVCRAEACRDEILDALDTLFGSY
jgi:toxin CcdB